MHWREEKTKEEEEQDVVSDGQEGVGPDTSVNAGGVLVKSIKVL